jgi:NitT/TauT family transport system ATP-binding protein
VEDSSTARETSLPGVSRAPGYGGNGHLTNSVITFREVGVRFSSETIYDDLTFDVEEGEFLCILGPSGCGKSTSLRIMGDLLAATTGEVAVGGRAPTDAWQDIAYIFQSPRLVPWRDALGNVALAMELRFDRMARSEIEARARELLSLVGLATDMRKFPSMLSGGERQRVAIARALSVDPKIILMDEPFSALDLNTRRRLREEIISIWRTTGKTIVFVTHDIDEALVLSDRVLLMSNKPTSLLETIEITEPRPRTIETSSGLRAHKAHLHALFRTLEPEALEDIEPAKEANA